MGQIVSDKARPKRCNLNALGSVPTPAAGEYILVSSDNSMNAAGQGNFDCYVEGNGTTAATALPLHTIADETPTLEGNNSVTGGGIYKFVFDTLGLKKTDKTIGTANVQKAFSAFYQYEVKATGSEISFSIDLTTDSTRLYIYSPAGTLQYYLTLSNGHAEGVLSGLPSGQKVLFYAYGQSAAGSANYEINETYYVNEFDKLYPLFQNVQDNVESLQDNVESLQSDAEEAGQELEDLGNFVGKDKINNVSETDAEIKYESKSTRFITKYTTVYDNSVVKISLSNISQSTADRIVSYTPSAGSNPVDAYIDSNNGAEITRDMQGYNAGTEIWVYAHVTDSSVAAGTCDYIIEETAEAPSNSLSSRVDSVEDNVEEVMGNMDTLQEETEGLIECVGKEETNEVSETGTEIAYRSQQTRFIAKYTTRYADSIVKMSFSNISQPAGDRIVSYAPSSGVNQIECVIGNDNSAEITRDMQGYAIGTEIWIYAHVTDVSAAAGTCDYHILETLKPASDSLLGRVEALEQNTQGGAIISPYKDKVVVCCGDSHAVRRAYWMPLLCQRIGALYDADTTATIVGSGNGTGSGYEEYGDPFLAQAVRVVEQYRQGKQIDVVIAENVHYNFQEEHFNNAFPLLIKNVIDNGATSVTKNNIDSWFNTNISTILGNVTPVLGTIVMFELTETKITLTFSGTPSAGAMILTIDGHDFTETLTGSETLNEAVQALGTWVFSDYTDWENTVNGNVITLTYIGSETTPPSPTISFAAGTTGLSMQSGTINTTSIYRRYFESVDTSDWLDYTKWRKVEVNWTPQGLKGFFEELQNNIPNVEIICLALPCYAVTQSQFINGLGQDMNAFYNSTFYTNNRNRALSFIQAAKYYNCKVLDIEKLQNISLQNWFSFFPSGGVHPNQNGYERWAMTAAKEII